VIDLSLVNFDVSVANFFLNTRSQECESVGKFKHKAIKNAVRSVYAYARKSCHKTGAVKEFKKTMTGELYYLAQLELIQKSCFHFGMLQQ
jgi:hypothetical protein